MFFRVQGRKRSRSKLRRVYPVGGRGQEKSFRDILFFTGKTVDPETGYLTEGRETEAANIEPMRVEKGTVLRWKQAACSYRLFFYREETEERLIHTFCYEPEENWASYAGERTYNTGEDACKSTSDRFQKTDWVFSEPGYIRLVILSPESQFLPGDLREVFELHDQFLSNDLRKVFELPDQSCTDDLQDVFELKNPYQPDDLREVDELKDHEAEGETDRLFESEITRLRQRLGAVRESGDTVLFLLTDTHYTVNGGWEETARNLKAAAAVCAPDGAVHLGDFTDGLLPGEQTKQYSGRILEDLREAAGKVYVCLGNHDSNFSQVNPEPFERDEAAAWYLGRTCPYYYEDLPEKKLRMFFLESFDHRRQEIYDGYGFSEEECAWLAENLEGTPEGYGVLIFSHVPLLPEMHRWSEGILRSEEVLQILETFQEKRSSILAFIHGHNHADQIMRTRAFPIISIGCSKLESFPEMKPEGAVCYERKRGAVTQDLWDVLRISRDKSRLDFIRFGAGEDRRLDLSSV